jgi:hypothetical protein
VTRAGSLSPSGADDDAVTRTSVVRLDDGSPRPLEASIVDDSSFQMLAAEQRIAGPRPAR